MQKISHKGKSLLLRVFVVGITLTKGPGILSPGLLPVL